MSEQANIITLDDTCTPTLRDLRCEITSGASDTAASALWYAMATNGAGGVNGDVGSFYLVDDFTADSVTSTDAVHITDSDGFYQNPSEVMVDRTAGTVFGNLTFNGGLAASFDGETIEAPANCSVNGTTTNPKVIGKDWGSGTTRTITKLEVFAQNNGPVWVGSITMKLQGSTDNFASSVVDLGSYTGTSATNSSANTIVSTVLGAYRYHRVIFETANQINTAEVQFYEVTSGQNMTLTSSAATLIDVDPRQLIGYVVIEQIDQLILGTDIVMSMGINGSGGSLIAGTWSKVGNVGGDGKELYRVDVDLSEPSGNDDQLAWKITTANNKQVRVHEIVGIVPIF